MELRKGTKLQKGKYRIEKVLGRGTFGITYLASAKLCMLGTLGKMDVDAKVAIKEFFMSDVNSRKDDGSSVSGTGTVFTSYRRKFSKEAENLAGLSHPDIVKVSDIFDENDTTYYVMEYIEGENLDDYIKSRGRIPEDEAVRIFKEIGNALSYMHSKKMLHLDMKPKNVMHRPDGSCCLIDFGLSKQFNDDGEPESSTSIGLGTPGYAPLEQAHYKQDGTFPATLDIYALGATMLKMLTGKTPPDSSYILNEGLPVQELHLARISEDIVKLIKTAMAPLKKDRYASVKDMMQNIHCNTGEEDDTIIDNMKKNDDDEQTIYKNNGNNGKKKKTFAYISILAGTVFFIGMLSFFFSHQNINNKTSTTKLISKPKIQEPSKPQIKYESFSEMSNIKIGDYVYSDGTFSHDGPISDKSCIGIIFSLKTTRAEKRQGWTHGQMVALKDAGDSAWSDDEADYPSPHKNIVTQLWTDKMISEIRNDKDGYVYSTSKYTKNCPAFKTARNYNVIIPFASSGWYIPSIGQWCDILENICGYQLQRDKNNYVEVKIVGENKSTLNFNTSAFQYWSSSERSRYYTWIFQPRKKGGDFTFGRKDMNGKIRAVTAF